MQHAAQPGYYDAAAEEVRSAKTGGYVHFYEFVDMYELDDTGQRKVRRVTQSLPMPELYATLAEALGKELRLTPGGTATRSAAWVGGRSGYQRRSLVGGVLQRLEAALGPIDDQTDWYTPINGPLAEGMPPERQGDDRMEDPAVPLVRDAGAPAEPACRPTARVVVLALDARVWNRRLCSICLIAISRTCSSSSLGD